MEPLWILSPDLKRTAQQAPLAQIIIARKQNFVTEGQIWFKMGGFHIEWNKECIRSNAPYKSKVMGMMRKIATVSWEDESY